MGTPPKPSFHDDTPLPDPVLAFGRNRGSRLSKVPSSYRRWLADPVGKDGAPVRIDPEIVAAAQAWVARRENTYAEFRLSGQVAPGDETTVYVVTSERHGTSSAHRSLEDALEAIRVGAPNEGNGTRADPDPESEQILVREILPTGHAKVVWHFSGWHFDAERYGLPQGTLPGDARPLYEISNDDGDGFA